MIQNLYLFSTDDVFSFRVKQTYGSLLGKIKITLKGFNTKASQKELSLFFETLQSNVKQINQISEIELFIIPPSNMNLDFEEKYYEGGQYGQNISIRDNLIPFLLDELETEDITYKSNIAQIIYCLFDYIPKSKIDKDYATSLINLIEKSMGINENIDEENMYYLKELKTIVQ